MLFAVKDPSQTKRLACAYLLTADLVCNAKNGTRTGCIGIEDIPRLCPPKAVNFDFDDPIACAIQSLTTAGWFEMSSISLSGPPININVQYSEDGWIKIKNGNPDPFYQTWCADPKPNHIVAISSGDLYWKLPGFRISASTAPRSYRGLMELASGLVNIEIALITDFQGPFDHS